MGKLSYSAHISNKQSAINSKAKLAGVAKHNLRKYRSSEYDKDNIKILYGTDKLVQDVKYVYHKEFNEAVKEYNKKQTREDRKIVDYFDHVSKKDKDMAVEIIFQVGDKDYWDNNEDKRLAMTDVYNGVLSQLRKVAPALVVANAVVHYDEASPHMHIVAVPVGEGYKKGLSKQVSKRKVCTKSFLENILQGELRDYTEKQIETRLGESLRNKTAGRNDDLTVAEYKVSKEIEKKDKLQKQNRDLEQEKLEMEKENDNLLVKYAKCIRNIRDSEKEHEKLMDTILLTKANAQFGDDMIDELATMLGRGPADPTKFMSAKNYRDNIVSNFLERIFDKVKDIVEMARSCFVELKRVNKERDLYKEKCECMELDRNCQKEKVEQLNKRNDELIESEKQLGYFKEYVPSELYNQIIERGEMEEKIISRESRRR